MRTTAALLLALAFGACGGTDEPTIDHLKQPAEAAPPGKLGPPHFRLTDAEMLARDNAARAEAAAHPRPEPPVHFDRTTPVTPSAATPGLLLVGEAVGTAKPKAIETIPQAVTVTSCNIGFDDPYTLNGIPASCKDVHGNYIAASQYAADSFACVTWYFGQNCGGGIGAIWAKPGINDHIHLSYVDPVQCIVPVGPNAGFFGYYNGSACVPYSPIYEHRTTSPHDSYDWVDVVAINGSTFVIQALTVTYNAADNYAEVCGHKPSTGSWECWALRQGYYTWGNGSGPYNEVRLYGAYYNNGETAGYDNLQIFQIGP